MKAKITTEKYIEVPLELMLQWCAGIGIIMNPHGTHKKDGRIEGVVFSFEGKEIKRTHLSDTVKFPLED